ncbi:MAG: DEAD/DEAH box helicase family protein [Prevotella sp.]|nr:DEAD/DEAH box helicase family protein [Prevotella sp.]
MIELKTYQRNAVNELKQRLVQLLGYDEHRQRLVLKAPTGSGKTVVASTAMDELTRELAAGAADCNYSSVAWVGLAPHQLHPQSYRSMRNFVCETRSLRPIWFDEAEVSEGLRPGEVLFLNWESVNKDNNLLIRDNEQNRTLGALLQKTREERPVVAVIDEEHMFAGRNAEKSERLLREVIKPKIELRISATPTSRSDYQVTIRREEVIGEEMIKKGVQLNPGVRSDTEQHALTVNQRLLQRALRKRDELAAAWQEYGINPLLLVQLPNDTKEALGDDERKIAEEVRTYLADPAIDITEENGRLAVWLSKEKSPNLADIIHPDDPTRVLLFKQAIALGWDCPRAAVLLIYRDLKSLVFTTQTVGRILRMPQQHFYTDYRLNYGYVYTNLSADMVQVSQDDMGYLGTVFANRREGLQNIDLRSVYMDHHQQRNRLGSGFRKLLADVIKERLNTAQTSLDLSNDDTEWTRQESEQATLFDEDVRHNRTLAHKRRLNLDVRNIFVELPKDMRLTGADGEVEVVEKARIAINVGEMRAALERYCREHVGSFGKYDSAPILQGALLDAMENLFGIPETEAPKVILYNHAPYNNRGFFEDAIAGALARYRNTLRQTATTKAYSQERFAIPATRPYNSAVVHPAEDIFNHALKPYFEQNNASKPERDFARWIDQRTEWVDWWYKNGDEGKQHFAIPYTGSDGGQRCFYVDFIVRLKNGTICLFDTKTLGSEEDTPEKNNALWKYVEEHNAKGKKMTGGVLVQLGENWYYPAGFIDDDKNTDGWSRLDLATL